jgi:hypothetical protein
MTIFPSARWQNWQRSIWTSAFSLYRRNIITIASMMALDVVRLSSSKPFSTSMMSYHARNCKTSIKIHRKYLFIKIKWSLVNEIHVIQGYLSIILHHLTYMYIYLIIGTVNT